LSRDGRDGSAILVMHLRRPWFDLVVAGSKTVDVRVAYPHRKDIVAGRLIRFESDRDHVLTRVVTVAHYRSFEEMLDHEKSAAIGGPGRSRTDLLAGLRVLYDESTESLGVMALEIELEQQPPPAIARNGDLTHGRVEYWHNPNAPIANTLVPACGVLAVNGSGEILLQRRRDTGQWALPMGKQEIGETPTQCAIRETKAETGVDVQIVGIYSHPAHIVAYTDGEVRQEYEATLLARPVGGTPAANDEASEVRWIGVDALAALDIHPTMRRQIDDYLAGHPPHID
jgi:8-oxo-dGTP pyrophosphatase MutT (NUDIX family)/ASC-1-like (ASCH) protein